jgi:hypothetical protein
MVIVCLKLVDSEVQGPQAARKWQYTKAKALSGCKNQMLHCSRINHVHFGVILAGWELYLSSKFNFIEQCKISQFFFNMTFVISEGECICCTKSSIVAILSLEPPNPLHKSNYAILTWWFVVVIKELFSHDGCILRISSWQLCIHKFSNVVDIQSLQCKVYPFNSLQSNP